jgi:hypothetical protein
MPKSTAAWVAVGATRTSGGTAVYISPASACGAHTRKKNMDKIEFLDVINSTTEIC